MVTNNFKNSKQLLRKCWEEITMQNTVAANSYHTVGLKADGTLVAVGKNDDGQCDVSGWKNLKTP